MQLCGYILFRHPKVGEAKDSNTDKVTEIFFCRIDCIKQHSKSP